MKKTLFLLAIFIIQAAQLSGAIINVPDHYGSIQQAIDASVNGDTVLVAPNTYFENIVYKGKNIVIGSLFLTTNDTGMISRTIIDGSENGSVVTIKNNEDSTAKLIGFTIRNGKSKYGGGIYIEAASPTISNCIIINNKVEDYNPIGGGIYMYNSRSIIYGCKIGYNIATGVDNNNGWGGGIAIESNSVGTIMNCKIHHNQVTSCYGGIGLANAKAKIIGCEITDNYSWGGGSGVGLQDTDLLLINSTIANNENGSGLYFIRSSPVIHNSIIWHNARSVDGWEGIPEIFYSNIQEGFDTLSVMDLEPMFVDTTAGDFRLQENSPCIDAGDPDTTGLNLPMYDLDGNLRFYDGNNDGTSVVDMGAYEYAPQPVSVEDKMVLNRPNIFYLNQNFPNPFNPTTQIHYSLSKSSLVTLKIYNLQGQEIRTLVDEFQSAGLKSVVWDGNDLQGNKASSALYFYRIETAEFAASKKMLLIR